ncbi:tyrosine--tRNA ligase 1, cytoplasmic-like [Rutidosis leptorrhynchoides]|uniref:tyrosine--tRNA ligase 1, cytoplasmic-like n=1 Tax=Rutidosis leptorrhynchoides TaxID=125765 RepID=UPI003A98F584
MEVLRYKVFPVRATRRASNPTPYSDVRNQQDYSLAVSNTSLAMDVNCLPYPIQIGEKCIQEDELLNLLTNKPHPICYDGFEPSGRMHIAQGIMKTINVNKLTSNGCKMKIWIADLFAQLNNKMGGDIEKIKTVGLYFIEIWKASGMDLDNVEFIFSSDEIKSRSDEYWRPLVLDIAQRNKIFRIKRCCQIMGRNEQDNLSAAQIFYPCMQCADIFFLKADICQLGMDQLKVNVLAREYCDDIKRENKPVILSHHMLPGLKDGQEKMSKSDLSSAIFMEDGEDDVNFKIMNAYCPDEIDKVNPCLEYVEDIVFPWFNEFKVERKEENGGEKVFTTYEELVAAYKKKDLSPADLQRALSKALNKILQPVRDHFKNDEYAKALLQKVKSFKVTK